MSAADYQRVWQVHATLRPKPDDLISTARFFVREGELGIWDEKKRQKKVRYFFLFNDILLLCKKESSKRYWLRIHITLRSPSVSIEEIGNSSFNHEFRLHCRSRSFMLYAPTSDAKDDWVRDIQKAIKGDFPQEHKDKQVQKQGQDLVKGDADTVKKISKKKRTETEQSEDDDDDEEEEDQEEEKQKPVAKERKKRPKKEKKPAEVSPTNALLLDLLGPTTPTATPALTLGVGIAPLPSTSGNPFLSSANPFAAPPTNIYSSGSGTQVPGVGIGTTFSAPSIYSSTGGTTSGFSNTSPFGASAFGTTPNAVGGIGLNPTVGVSNPVGGTPLFSGTTSSNPFAPTGASFSGPAPGNPFLGGGTGANSLSAFGGTSSFGVPPSTPGANPFGVPASSGPSNPFLNSTPNGGFF